MAVHSKVRLRTPKDALLSAIVGAWAVLVVLVLSPEAAAHQHAGLLLGAWLCIGSLVQWWALRGRTQRSIPLAFAGETGRFRLRVRGHGRRVDVHSGLRVVAQASATPKGDSLVVNFDAVIDSELEALGAAIGQAMQLVAAAGNDRPGKRTRRPVPRGGSHDHGPGSGIVRRELRTPSAHSPGASTSLLPLGATSPAPVTHLPQRRPNREAYRPLVGLTRQELTEWTRRTRQRPADPPRRGPAMS